jgi:hypothetical protein
MIHQGFIVIAGAATSSNVVVGAAANSGNQSLIFAAVIGGVATVLAAILMTRRSSKAQLAAIQVNVDGRLEKALEKIDRLEGALSAITGVKAPPPVSGEGKDKLTVDTVVERADKVPIVEAPVVVVNPTPPGTIAS